ncbi:MAG TPA: hypothetical protein P5121_34800, partial [Caldilineaceae bacterium]|nr:hypothetical protein [Caldilineaceae bacterium]
MTLIVLIILFIVLFIVRSCQNVITPLTGVSTAVPTYTFDIAVVRPIIVAPANGISLNASQVAFRGTGAANATVQLLLNQRVADEVQVDRDGNWVATAAIDESGNYTAVAQALDAGGTLLAESRPLRLSVTVPTATPTEVAPIVLAATATLTEAVSSPATREPSDYLTVEGLLFQNSRQGSEVVVNGGGRPGIQAQLLANASVVNSTTVSSDGLWSMVTQLDNPNQYELALQAVITDGTTLPVAIPMNALVVAVPTATETPEPEVLPTLVVPPAVSAFIFDRGITTNTVTLNGSGAPGALLEVAIDESPAVTTTVNLSGTWQTSAVIGGVGSHQVEVRSLDEAGNIIAAAAPFTLVVAEQPTATPTETPVPTLTATATPVPPSFRTSATSLQVGDTLTLHGMGRPGDLIDIIVGGNVISTTEVAADGTFDYALSFGSSGVQYVGVRARGEDGSEVMGRNVAYIIVNPAPTATPTETPVPTATDTVTPEPTATETETPVPTDTATSE